MYQVMNKLQANTGWLEPLLARVAESASHVVTPVITIIILPSYSLYMCSLKKASTLYLLISIVFIPGYRPDQPRHIQLHCFAVSKVPLNCFHYFADKKLDLCFLSFSIVTTVSDSLFLPEEVSTEKS